MIALAYKVSSVHMHCNMTLCIHTYVCMHACAMYLTGERHGIRCSTDSERVPTSQARRVPEGNVLQHWNTVSSACSGDDTHCLMNYS